MSIVKHLGIAVLAVALLSSCDQKSPENHKIVPGNKTPEKVETLPPASATPQSNTNSGQPDQYGRMPGDAHYGHDHPLLEEELNNQGGQVPMQQQQQQGSGEPDAYGRMPGDAHYGHDHP